MLWGSEIVPSGIRDRAYFRDRPMNPIDLSPSGSFITRQMGDRSEDRPDPDCRRE